jgi:hypothetical protein
MTARHEDDLEILVRFVLFEDGKLVIVVESSNGGRGFGAITIAFGRIFIHCSGTGAWLIWAEVVAFAGFLGAFVLPVACLATVEASSFGASFILFMLG